MPIRLALIRLARRLRARRTLGLAVASAVVVAAVLMNAAAYLIFDGPGNPDLGLGDALWYSVVSITTIGYGDLSAQSTGARVSTVVFIIAIGLGAFSVLVGMVVEGLTEAAARGRRGLGMVTASDHVLIVNVPSEARVRQLIDEIRSDAEHAAHEIVVIDPTLPELPFRVEGVFYVRGGIHDPETYRRASAHAAKMAIVLSPDYADPSSDAIAAAAVSVIDAIRPDIHIVAECVQDNHRALFRAVRCDAIVAGMRMAGNLLVQEMHDPGISRVMEVITSNRTGDTLFSTGVPEDGGGVDYLALVQHLQAHNVNVIAINRGEDTLTTFCGVSSLPGDRLIYIARRRGTWAQLASAQPKA